MLFVAYHGGQNFPLTNEVDSLWDRVYAWYPYPRDGIIKLNFGRDSLGPVVGRASLVGPNGDTVSDNEGTWTFVNGHRTRGGRGGIPIYTYEAISNIEEALRAGPQALIDLTLERQGDSLFATAAVDSILGQHRRLVVRMVMYEDSVRVTGATNRRMHLNVTRGVASQGPLTLGVAVPNDRPSTTRYGFDLAKAQNDILGLLDPVRQIELLFSKEQQKEGDFEGNLKMQRQFIADYPAYLDWTINQDRLYLLAFVQDLDSGEILQGVVLKVPAAGRKAEKRG